VTRQQGLVLLDSAMYRVLSPQRIRTYNIGFYSNFVADTLLSLCPCRVFLTLEMNRISPGLLSHACPLKIAETTLKIRIKEFW
jgi:hypothetical protein